MIAPDSFHSLDSHSHEPRIHPLDGYLVTKYEYPLSNSRGGRNKTFDIEFTLFRIDEGGTKPASPILPSFRQSQRRSQLSIHLSNHLSNHLSTHLSTSITTYRTWLRSHLVTRRRSFIISPKTGISGYLLYESKRQIKRFGTLSNLVFRLHRSLARNLSNLPMALVRRQRNSIKKPSIFSKLSALCQIRQMIHYHFHYRPRQT